MEQMSGISAPIADLKALLTSITFRNNAGQTIGLFSEVWNNHFKSLEDGTTYSFPLPAALIEVINPANYTQLAFGITESDITFRIHIGMEQLDSGTGTMDENLTIFALRDAVIAKLTYQELTACSGLMKVSENQDYNHDNLYVYTIDFVCSFIDDLGDTRRTQTASVPPTHLVLDTELVDKITE